MTRNEYTEASYYLQTSKGIRCILCPSQCLISDGDLGKCHSRKAIDGKLYSMAYNRPCAIHIDPIEKKPFLNYKPGSMVFSLGTAGCNFTCLNCQNYNISQSRPDQNESFGLSPEDLVKNAINEMCPAIAYTYTEPSTYFEYMLEISKIAKYSGLDNLMVSNGFINEKPLKELSPYLHAANIDLKIFDDNIYQKLTGGRLSPVLRSLKILRDHGVWIEITNLMIPEWSDDLKIVDKMCKWLSINGFDDYPLHFSRFHPTYKLKNLTATPLQLLLDARDIAKNHGLKHVYIGNVHEIEGDNTFCPECQKLVIKRNRYQIISNIIVNGSCPFCKNTISGVWCN